jgi:hypothetical protein
MQEKQEQTLRQLVKRRGYKKKKRSDIKTGHDAKFVEQNSVVCQAIHCCVLPFNR